MSDTTENPYFKLAPGAVKRWGVDLSRTLVNQPGVTVSSVTATILKNGVVDAGITAASSSVSGTRASLLFSGVVEAELGTTWTVDLACALSNGETDVRTIYIQAERVS